MINEYLSTSAIARNYKIRTKDLFYYLMSKSYLYKEGKHYKLTDSGFKLGGRYREQKEYTNVVWARNCLDEIIADNLAPHLKGGKYRYPSGFKGGSMEEDKIISAIESGEINAQNISFDIIKKEAITPTPTDVHGELDYGHAILDTQDQLNKYIYSYSAMIKSQWVQMFNSLKVPLGNIEIIDYACGQGLASMLFFDKHKDARNRSNITLIEPSEIALNRAKKILRCYMPKAKVKTINKVLDDIAENDIQADDSAIKLHLFSNIVDMDIFNIGKLLDKITTIKGKNYFIVMSSNRDSHGGSPRLNVFYNYFKNNDLYKVIKAEKNSFVMKNPSTYPGAKDFNVRYVYIETKV